MLRLSVLKPAIRLNVLRALFDVRLPALSLPDLGFLSIQILLYYLQIPFQLFPALILGGWLAPLCQIQLFLLSHSLSLNISQLLVLILFLSWQETPHLCNLPTDLSNVHTEHFLFDPGKDILAVEKESRHGSFRRKGFVYNLLTWHLVCCE